MLFMLWHHLTFGFHIYIYHNGKYEAQNDTVIDLKNTVEFAYDMLILLIIVLIGLLATNFIEIEMKTQQVNES